jgi:hypothetical protein
MRAAGPAAAHGGGGGGIALLMAIFVGVLSLCMYLGIHKVEEGHVGMYWRGGALLNSVSEPGFHTMIPLITSTANVQTTIVSRKTAAAAAVF